MRLFILLIAACLLSSCVPAPFPREIFDNGNVLKFWALADIQAVKQKDWRAFQNAVDDMNRNTKGILMALVAGDLVDFTTGENFDRYTAIRNKSLIKDWREIAGNHDLKRDGGALYREKIGDFHHTANYGNILFIFLSDEARGKSTTINDDTFLWWEKTVSQNQDKILVVVTHAPLEGSSIIFSGLKGRKILRSGRFVEILKNEKVDLWLSGHLHIPHFFPRTVTRGKKLNDTVFIHISSIRPEIGGLKHPESRFLAFYCGTNKLSVFSRNHKKREWQNRRSKHFKLSKTVVCPK